MHTFQITIERGATKDWTVAVDHSTGAHTPPSRREGTMQLGPEEGTKLLEAMTRPKDYGILLGEALFRDGVGDAFAGALDAALAADEPLRVRLTIEDAELRKHRWGRLCAPFPGGWGHLALNQGSPFSRYLPSKPDGRFLPMARGDLRALVLVACPEGQEPFDVAGTVRAVREALGKEMPVDVLARDDGDGPATLDALASRLTDGGHTLLHIVCHGVARRGQTTLFLEDRDGKEDRVPEERLIERLRNLFHPPHFVFLSACESADDDGDDRFGGLAPRLVGELGMPAVVAMSDRVTVATASLLSTRFYQRLHVHGEPDLALVEAFAGLADRGDVLVPVLFSRLADRPLFDTVDRGVAGLTGEEIGRGLDRLEAELPRRAPVLVPRLTELAQTLRPLLATNRVGLSHEQQAVQAQTIDEISALCLETLDITFAALAQNQDPPPYDDRQPFRGLHPFRPEDRDFFFGRESLVERLQENLAAHPFLPVIGPSGSGKTSAVLAGLIPRLEQDEPGLQWVDFRPGGSPTAALDAALARLPNQDGVLIADQFEEIFLCCHDSEERDTFIDALLGRAGARRVVLTMRTGFEADCAAYPALYEAIQAHQGLVPMMDPTELRSAVERQATAALLRFEADLAATILDDVQSGPGAMRLLQQVLLELWARRHGRWLRGEEYREMGGVEQLVVGAATAFYDALTPMEQAQARDIIIRLIRLNEDDDGGGKQDNVPRPVILADLFSEGSDPDGVRQLAHRMATAGLLVVS